jgi:hypothetical protein
MYVVIGPTGPAGNSVSVVDLGNGCVDLVDDQNNILATICDGATGPTGPSGPTGPAGTRILSSEIRYNS